MKTSVKYFLSITFLNLLFLCAQSSEIMIPDGSSLHIPMGAQIGAGTIVVSSGGSFSTEDESGLSEGTVLNGDGALPVELSISAPHSKMISLFSTGKQRPRLIISVLKLSEPGFALQTLSRRSGKREDLYWEMETVILQNNMNSSIPF